MPSKVKISPSILSADFSKLGAEIYELEKAGADLIHIDVMDGHFVPNITMGPEIIKSLRKHTSLPFDVHLMISSVDKYIKNFAEAGADIITIHPESTDNLIETINEIKKFGKKAGVSLNPKTTIEKVKLLRKEIDQKKFAVEIEIDGGINFDNAKIVKKAGVDILVSGTTIFKNNEGNIKKNIETLRNN